MTFTSSLPYIHTPKVKKKKKNGHLFRKLAKRIKKNKSQNDDTATISGIVVVPTNVFPHQNGATPGAAIVMTRAILRFRLLDEFVDQK